MPEKIRVSLVRGRKFSLVLMGFAFLGDAAVAGRAGFAVLARGSGAQPPVQFATPVQVDRRDLARCSRASSSPTGQTDQIWWKWGEFGRRVLVSALRPFISDLPTFNVM